MNPSWMMVWFSFLPENWIVRFLRWHFHEKYPSSSPVQSVHRHWPNGGARNWILSPFPSAFSSYSSMDRTDTEPFSPMNFILISIFPALRRIKIKNVFQFNYLSFLLLLGLFYMDKQNLRIKYKILPGNGWGTDETELNEWKSWKDSRCSRLLSILSSHPPLFLVHFLFFQFSLTLHFNIFHKVLVYPTN